MRWLKRIRVLPALIVLAVASPGRAAEPHLGITVKNNWVTTRLTQDDQPVRDAAIKVFDERGQLFAEGETGSDGQGGFPLPTGHAFTVEIRIGERTADPIRLTRVGTAVVPERVLLSFGLRPCCKIPNRGGSPTRGGAASIPNGLPFGLALTGGACLVVGGWVLLKTRHPTVDGQSQSSPTDSFGGNRGQRS